AVWQHAARGRLSWLSACRIDSSSFASLRLALTRASSPSMLTRSPPPRSVESLLRAARCNLGQIGLKQAQKAVRSEMLYAALKAANGNRHAAARMLMVDR